MITNSNPFLRNDYYPDQNDLDDLNTRINEVQSDVDLLAISVNEKTEAVNGRLNNLQDNYNESFETEALKANTADLNVLNVNVQATIKDLNVVNTYTENLIVNKPVQDLSLRTPHLENTTSLNGNFYAPNIIGGEANGIERANIQNLDAANTYTENLVAVNLNAATTYLENLVVLKPVADLTLEAPNINNAESLNGNFYAPNILGGELDNVKLTNLQNLDAINIELANVQNLDAANIEANEIKANKLIGDFSAKPISSSAVVGYDENGQLIPVRASYDVSFPDNADYLKTDLQGVARKGTSESEVVQSTNLIQAGAVQNMYDAVNANVNNIKLNINNIESNVKNINDFIFNDIYIPEYGLFNSSSPVNYQNAVDVELYGDAQGGTAIPGGGGLIKFDSAANKVTFGFSSACKVIKNASRMFFSCYKLNQNIALPSFATDCYGVFDGCINLNQNIAVPNSVINCSKMFYGCRNLDQNILIPNSVVNCASMFISCTSLNQNILIPNSVVDCVGMFTSCTSLNQNILIPNSVVNCAMMFGVCTNLNQDIYLYSQNVTAAGMADMFYGTKVNMFNIHIPSSVPKDTSNGLYNCLVNSQTGVVFAADNIINDLPVDPVVWPPL